MNSDSTTDRPTEMRSMALKGLAHGSLPKPSLRSIIGDVGFFLFILVNAVLFIRPTEIIPRLTDWPIYEVLFFACLVVSFREVFEQFTPRSIVIRPITACVLGVLVTVVLSQFWRLDFGKGYESGRDFLKLVFYYLLLVAVVNTPRRMRWFLGCVAAFACVQLSLAVAQHHGLIDLPPLRPVEEQEIARAAGETILQYRICGIGIFHDPNDLAVLAATATTLCLYQVSRFTSDRGKARWVRAFAWTCAIFICGYGLMLTQSRGGFIALVAGVGVFFITRFGWWKSIIIAAITLPILLSLYSGRQTDPRMLRRTTAQSRLGFWAQGLRLFVESPIFGVGYGNFRHEVGNVAHNSFVQSFTELGFFGGTFFLGAFSLALWMVGRSSTTSTDDVKGDTETQNQRPCVLAAIAAWCAGMLSLSRSYVPPTYMLLGLATAYVELAQQGLTVSRLRVDARLGVRLAVLGVAFLICVYAFVSFFLRR